VSQTVGGAAGRDGDVNLAKGIRSYVRSGLTELHRCEIWHGLCAAINVMI
jgi:hypothetical protein